MRYEYIKQDKLKELVDTNRVALIFINIQTKDICEYINCMLASFKSEGLNTELLNKPKLVKHKKLGNQDLYDVIFVYKKSKSIPTEETMQFFTLSHKMGVPITPANYIDKHKLNKYTYDTLINLINDSTQQNVDNLHKTQPYILFKDTKNNICTAKFSMFKTLDSITSTKIEFTDNKRLVIDTNVSNCKNNIYDIIAYSCREPFKTDKLNPAYLLFYTQNGVYYFNIEITEKSINITQFI